jgi:hypothetical protein
MSMADVGVVVSVHCHVIVAQVNMAVMDVSWRTIDIDPVRVMRRLPTCEYSACSVSRVHAV